MQVMKDYPFDEVQTGFVLAKIITSIHQLKDMCFI